MITKEDFPLACELLSLVEEFGVDEAERILDDRHQDDLRREQKSKREQMYQRLLSMAGGDAEILARVLFASGLESEKPPSESNGIPVPTGGRRPDKWGHDGAGKIMLYVLVNREIEKMKLEGIEKTPIRAAVARILEIPLKVQERNGNKIKICDYASRYSEAKQILKPSE